MDLKTDLDKICSNVQMETEILERESNIDFFSEYLSHFSQFKNRYKAILRPENISELEEIVEYANKHKLSLIPKSGGNSFAGQLYPINDDLLLNLSNFNKIVEINIADRYAIVECGVTLEQILPELSKNKFYFPPSFNNSKKLTMGGLIGNNISNTYRYYTCDYILGLEVMLANGEIIKTGSRTLKNVSGYNTTSMFVGSEGSLGIILKAVIKIDPIPSNPKVLTVEISQPETQMNWLNDICLDRELNFIEILNEKHVVHLVLETTEQFVATFNEEFKGLKINSTFGVQEYSEIQEKIKTNIINEIRTNKTLIFGFKSNIRKIHETLNIIEKIKQTFQLNLKFNLTIVNQNVYFVLLFSHKSLDEMKNIIKARLELINFIKSSALGLIPDFGLGIWNQVKLDQDIQTIKNYKDEIKSVFDTNQILNTKNVQSEKIQRLLQLIEKT